MEKESIQSIYSGDVPPERDQRRRAYPAGARHVAIELCRRVVSSKASLVDIEEAIDRGHYCLEKISDIAMFAECHGGLGGSVVKAAAIEILGDRLEEKTLAQLSAEMLRYWE